MTDWNNVVKRIIKSELVKKGMSNNDLATLLNETGCQETKASIDSKLSRGTFSASFLLQSLYVLGCHKIEIEDYDNQELNFAAEPNVEYKHKRP